MTDDFLPLIKPDVQICRIRHSESGNLFGFMSVSVIQIR